MDLHKLTIHQLHALIAKKEVSSKEATDALYRHIRRVDGKIGAYLLLTEAEAYRQAEEMDRKISRGEAIGDLAGIPMGLKDISARRASGPPAAREYWRITSPSMTARWSED